MTGIWAKSTRETAAALTPAALRAVERALREEVRQEVGTLLDERQVLVPDRQDEERIRAMIAEQVEAYQRRAAGTNRPPLPDPAGVAGRLFDDLLRLGPLQPLMEDP